MLHYSQSLQLTGRNEIANSKSCLNHIITKSLLIEHGIGNLLKANISSSSILWIDLESVIRLCGCIQHHRIRYIVALRVINQQRDIIGTISRIIRQGDSR